jgi:threonine dehydrogenase-like Zn-dependent dehydrogenase
MEAVLLSADWCPRPGYRSSVRDIAGELTYLGSRVWRNPRLSLGEVAAPSVGDADVLIEVKACGICGSDVHMAQPDSDGYILYPGLTAFPVVLGHEFSGVVVEAGRHAIDKRTGRPYQGGEAVCSEEMFWCSCCRPCADGYPNHCEALQELGFSVNGAFTKYVAIHSRYLWNLEPLKKVYSDEQSLFIAGSLVEPVSVAYNAVIERGGGIRVGDNVVILGGGPIGLAAAALLRRAGAANVILSETQVERGKLALRMGASHVIHPQRENFTQRVLEITDGMGADLYLEATGLPDRVFADIESTIWEGKALNAKVVVVARADAKIPLTGEVFQVRRASLIGAQGHSGHGTFPRVISAMSSGLDMTAICTKKISLREVPEHIVSLRKNREEAKITAII